MLQFFFYLLVRSNQEYSEEFSNIQKKYQKYERFSDGQGIMAKRSMWNRENLYGKFEHGIN